MLYQRNTLVKELEVEKADLAQQMVALQDDFNTLNSDYESINHQLDTSREQVALLIEKLSKTEATNRAKIRQYEKELGTLRSIMKGYIVQIDSLNTLNKKLTADAAAARREAAESRRANEQLTQQVENLSEPGERRQNPQGPWHLPAGPLQQRQSGRPPQPRALHDRQPLAGREHPGRQRSRTHLCPRERTRKGSCC